MLPSVVKIVRLCLHALLCLLLCCCSEAALLAFGDSFMDSGNNNFIFKTLVKANFRPYGKDFMGGKPTGRFTNGNTIADFMAEKLGVKDHLPAYLDPLVQDSDLPTGVSFASGGSGYDPETSNLANVIPLSAQLDMFKEYIGRLKQLVGEEATNDIIRKSVYLVSASSNDWGISFTGVPIRRFQYDVPTYANLLANLASNFSQELYKMGARKIAIFNTPLIGCFPLARTVVGVFRTCGEKFNEEAKSFNSMLKRQIQFLGSSLQESRFIIVDFFQLVQDIIENPHQYGFEVVDRGCCGTGELEVAVLCNKLSSICPDESKFLFWDSVHLTEKGYNIVVNNALPHLMANL